MEYFNPIENCILCYSCPDYNNDFSSDQQWGRLTLSIISSSLKHIPQDITEPVNWDELELNKSLHLCNLCNETLGKLSKLNSEFEEIQRKISELVNTICSHVRNEREKYGYTSRQKIVNLLDNTNLNEKNRKVVCEDNSDDLYNDYESINSEQAGTPHSSENDNVTKSDTDNLEGNSSSSEDASFISSKIQSTKPTQLKSSQPATSSTNVKLSRLSSLRSSTTSCSKPSVASKNDSSGFDSPKSSSHSSVTPESKTVTYSPSHVKKPESHCPKSTAARVELNEPSSSSRLSSPKDSSPEINIKEKLSPVLIDDHLTELQGDPPMYQCKVCMKKFKTKAHIKCKELYQNGEKPFKCEQCGQGFKARTHYEYHLRTHTGERPYICPKCGKGFNQRGKVTLHMRSHTGEKPFPCKQCGRGFANPQALKAHFLIHTGERPFACQHCNKRFTGMTNLKKHVITHTGECPFMCQHCGKSFGLKWTLDLHLRTHSSERTYTCNQCAQAFSNSKDLSRHLVTHSVPQIQNLKGNSSEKSRNLTIGKRKSRKANYQESSSERGETTSKNSNDEDKTDNIKLKVEVKVEDEFLS